jgi:hypothetical protein
MTVKLVASLAFALVAPLGAQAAPGQSLQAAGPAIDSMVLRAHTYFLAHDLLEGRGTGRRGSDVAALYLASAAEALGLRGPGRDGSYFQDVPLVEADIDTAETRLVVTVAGEPADSPATRHVFTTPGEFIANVGTTRTLVSFGGELAYVGTAPEILAHPERLPPLGGRVALLRGVFGPDAAAADSLRSRGATGVVHLVGAADRYALYVRSRGPSRMFVDEDAHAVSSFIPDIPAVLAGPALERLLGVPPAGGEQDRPALLPGRRIDVRIAIRARRFISRNVAAILPAADTARRGEFIAYTAHYDHLGISTPDARGDSIYNGFSDNAAGCAMLLAIAKAMRDGPRPARSVLFIWFTGEERGLLGSDYFAAHPLAPPDRIVGAINLDAGAPPAPSASWHVAGGDRSALGPLAVAVARRAGWEAQTVPASPNTDYYPLLRVGIPAVFLVPGPGPFEGLTVEASRALRQRWDHYHEAADEWAPDFPFSGLVRYAEFAYRLGMEAAAAPRGPVAQLR